MDGEEPQRPGLGEPPKFEPVKRLASDLSQRFGRGFSERNLEQMRGFHLGWPMMHAAERFELWTLVQRYEEMLSGGYIGTPGTLRANFLALVSTLFGDDAAEDLDRHLKRV